MASSDEFDLFTTNGITVNTSRRTAIVPSIEQRLLDNQHLQDDMYTYKVDSTIARIDHDFIRIEQIYTSGGLSQVEFSDAKDILTSAKEEWVSVKVKSSADRNLLNGYELEQMNAMSGGDHIRQATAESEARAETESIQRSHQILAKAEAKTKEAREEWIKFTTDKSASLTKLKQTQDAVEEMQIKFSLGKITIQELMPYVEANKVQYKNAQGFLNQTKEAENNLANMEELGRKASQGFSVAEEGFNALRTFDRSIGPINVSIRTVTNAMGAYTDPLVNLVKNLNKVKVLLNQGFDRFALKGIEGASNSRYLAQINRVTEEQIHELGLSDTMKQQLKSIEKIRLETGGGEEMSEKLIEEASKWMGPSWRLIAARKAEAWELFAPLSNGSGSKLLEVFLLRPGGALKLGLETIFNIPRVVLYKILEKTLGVVTTEAIIETAAAMTRYTIAQSASHLAPEVQTLLLIGYMVWDKHLTHSFDQWIGDGIKFVTCGLIPVDSLEISGYGKFSSPGKNSVGEGPEKMWKLDYDELKSSIDFWGKHFVEMNAEMHGHPIPLYTPYKEFKGLTRKVGQYIDPNNLQYDSHAELQACLELEKSLDLGIIVDEAGRLTGADQGGQMVSTLLPREPGLVRNLVNFPLYRTTITWPDRDGVFTQTEGQFLPSNIDEGIAKTFNFWIKTGRWGPAFTDPHSTNRTRRIAMEKNLADYEAWMNPKITDPFAWVDAQDWAKGNIGKRAILRQEMHGVTLTILLKEMDNDFPTEPDSNYIYIFNGSAHQDTLDFVNTVFDKTGRYPFTPSSRKFYDDVIHNKKTSYVEIMTGPMGILQIVSRRDSTEAEIHLFTTVVKQLTDYINALRTSKENTEQAWESVFKQTLWDAYVADTSPRTIWNYIISIRPLLILELESQVSLMAGRKRTKLYEDFSKVVNKAGLPLNTNRFGRVAFVARLNQLLFSGEKDIEKQIEEHSGKILKNLLFTTAEKAGDVWGSLVVAVDKVGKETLDLPTLFGAVNCRIIVVSKPRKTCFVVFKETNRFWDWAIEADFTGAEFSSVVPGKDPGTFSLKLVSKENALVSGIKALYENSETFTLHRGFLRVWSAFKDHIQKALLDIYKTIGVEVVIVTGHGMGAAVAQVACFEIPSNPVPKKTKASSLSLISGLKPVTEVNYNRPHAYLYASPPVGDQKFGWHFNNITSESAQVYVDGDVATMVPPFLIPSDTYNGLKGVTTLNDVLSFTDSTQLKGEWGLLNRLYKYSNLPQFDLRQFATHDGEIDWKQIAGGVTEIFRTATQHKAIRGGGVFMVLPYDNSGHVDEFHSDPGISVGSIEILTHAAFDTDVVRERHSLDGIVQKLRAVAKDHPDLFEAIDKNEASWDHETANIHEKPEFPDPPTHSLVPVKGRVVAVARCKKRQHPGSLITMDDIDHSSIVMLPDVTEMKRVRLQQHRRLKIRKKTEGEYHGY